MSVNNYVNFNVELGGHSAAWWSKWIEQRDAYADELIASFNEAIAQAKQELCEAARQRVPWSDYSGVLDTAKHNRDLLRHDQLVNLKTQAENLKTTLTPGNTLQHIVSTLNKTNILWEGTSLLDRPLFVIKKIVAFFTPAKSATLFHSQYDKLKSLSDRADAIKNFSR